MSTCDDFGSRPSSAGSNKSAAPRARRGGYKDAGGVGVGGVLEAAEPVTLNSERELQKEIEAIACNLDPKVDWNKRIEALNRLESLVAGGAAHWQNFAELLRNQLRDLLSLQISDRRSAVSRQVCRLLEVLATEVGAGFNALAVHFIDDLLKVLVITVQVMYEAADGAMRSLLEHCRPHQLLKQLTGPLISDRSVKLRHCCATYLLQVLDTWEPPEWRRASESVIKAVAAACGDASSETRALGRACHGVLATTAPAAAAAVVAALPPAVRNQLSTMGRGDSQPRSSSSSSSGGPAGRGLTFLQRPARQSSSGGSQSDGFSAASLRSQPRTLAPQRLSSGLPQGPSRLPPRTTSIADSRLSDNGVLTTPGGRPLRRLNQGGRHVPDSAMGSGSRRRSAIPPPQRATSDADHLQLRRSAATDETMAAPCHARTTSGRTPQRRATIAMAGYTGVPHPQPPALSRSWDCAPTGGLPWSVGSPAEEAMPAPGVDGDVPSEEASPTLDSLTAAVVRGGGDDWHSRAAAYDRLRLLMWQEGSKAASLLATQAPLLLPCLSEDLGNVHSRVATASAGALSAVAVGCGPTLERHLPGVLPPLLCVAANERRSEVALAANRVLQDMAESMDPRVVLRSLTAALDGSVSEEVRVKTLNFFTRKLAPCLALLPPATTEDCTPGAAADVAVWRRSVEALMRSAEEGKAVRRAAAAAAAAAQPWAALTGPALEPPLEASSMEICSDDVALGNEDSRSTTAAAAAMRKLAQMRLSAEFQPLSHPLLESPSSAVTSSPGRPGSCSREGGSDPSDTVAGLSASQQQEQQVRGPRIHLSEKQAKSPQLYGPSANPSFSLASGTAMVAAATEVPTSCDAGRAADVAAVYNAEADLMNSKTNGTPLPPQHTAGTSKQTTHDSAAPRNSPRQPRWAASDDVSQNGNSLSVYTPSLSNHVEQLGGGCTARLAAGDPVVKRFCPQLGHAASLAPAGLREEEVASEQQQQPQLQQLWGQQARGEQQLRELAELPGSPAPWELRSNITPTGATAAFLKEDLLSGLATAITPIAHQQARGPGDVQQQTKDQHPSQQRSSDAASTPQQQQQQQQQQYRGIRGKQPALEQIPALEYPVQNRSSKKPAAVQMQALLEPDGAPGQAAAQHVHHLLSSCLIDADAQDTVREEVSAAAAIAPEAVLHVIQPHLLAAADAASTTLLVAIAGTTTATAALSDGDLVAAVHRGDVLQGLFAALGHSASEVRKATILALVDISMRLGEEAPQMLSQLSPAQAKLLSIYVAKAAKKKAAANT